MTQQDNDRIVFGKEDLVPLDTLPSAISPKAMVLASPRGGIIRRLLRYILVFVGLIIAVVGGLLVALDYGALDRTLAAQAQSGLNAALGSDFDATVAETKLRLSGAHLALETANVRIIDTKSNRALLSADTISMALDPFALVAGRFVFDHIDVGNAEVDASFMAVGAPPDWKALRIDQLPDLEKLGYAMADKAVARLADSPAAKFSMASLRLTLPSASGSPIPLLIDHIAFERSRTSFSVNGRIFSRDIRASVGAVVQINGTRAEAITADVTGLPTAAFLLKPSSHFPGPLSGIDAPISVSLKSERYDPEGQGALSAKVSLGKGQLWAERISQDLTSATIDVNYDWARQTLSVEQGEILLGSTIIPFQTSIIDRDRLEAGAGRGLAFDLVINDAIAATDAEGEKPLKLNARASAIFDPDTMRLSVTPITISTPTGNVAATMALTLGVGSPELSFSMRTDEININAVKQLWPYWVAREPRKWLFGNLYDGTISNGEVDVLIPAGAMVEGKPPILNADELSIRFDIKGTRFNFLGDIPPARNASGHFEMSGAQMAVKIPSADVFLGSGDAVHISDAAMTINDTHEKPLMADVALSASGKAQSVAELATLNPIAALQKTEFKVDDFAGNVTARISANVGLVAEQKPPKPQWQANLVLDKVSLTRPFANHKVTDLVGTLDIGPKGIRLESATKVDGIPFKLALSQALDDPKGTKRRFSLTGKLGDADLAKFAPSLSDFIDGKMDLRIEADNQGNQKITSDLRQASLTVPWIGWKKGVGIPASVTFSAQAKDGVTRISDFKLKGDGFGADGDLVSDKSGLVSAKFSRVQLTPNDRYQMSLKRADGALTIDVRGSQADLRPIIGSLKTSTAKSRQSSVAMRVTVNLDNAMGYNSESFGSLKAKLRSADGRLTSLELSATTKSGEAVVANKDDDQKAIEITSGDAGALFRFADLYRNMQGGLLNIKLRGKDEDSWRGSVDVRNFALINEQRLKSIVSTPAGQDGRSLNDAVRQEIDVSTQKFRRGFARVLVDGSAIRVENGVVRGDEVGATFQGAIRDEKNRMDMTGTFMPAYGLNRLFAELPIIGAILGNGSDRGLLGITFKLVGPADNPKLTVNPLSLIAPGVFRNIFEFE